LYEKSDALTWSDGSWCLGLRLKDSLTKARRGFVV
jgi:hypothetical protein